jgi:hypothetical protein
MLHTVTTPPYARREQAAAGIARDGQAIKRE